MASTKTAKAPKMATVRYERSEYTATKEHTLRQYIRETNHLGQDVVTKIVEDLPAEIIMNDGDEFQIPKDDLDKLVKYGVVRSKAQVTARKQLIKDKKALYKMSDADRTLLLNDRPYEV